MSEPTSEQVRDLWKYMTEKFGTVVIDKSQSEAMRWVSRLLGQLRLSDPDQFMRLYTTTIDGRIYTPFDPGVPNDAWTLWDQIVVCAHEHTHVLQQREMGTACFDAVYVTDSDARARFEAKAYVCTLELEQWRYGRFSMPGAVATNLAGYGCTSEQIAMGADIIRSMAATVEAGGIVNEASRVVIEWLSQHAPQIREV